MLDGVGQAQGFTLTNKCLAGINKVLHKVNKEKLLHSVTQSAVDVLNKGLNSTRALKTQLNITAEQVNTPVPFVI